LLSLPKENAPERKSSLDKTQLALELLLLFARWKLCCSLLPKIKNLPKHVDYYRWLNLALLYLGWLLDALLLMSPQQSVAATRLLYIVLQYLASDITVRELAHPCLRRVRPKKFPIGSHNVCSQSHQRLAGWLAAAMLWHLPCSEEQVAVEKSCTATRRIEEQQQQQHGIRSLNFSCRFKLYGCTYPSSWLWLLLTTNDGVHDVCLACVAVRSVSSWSVRCGRCVVDMRLRSIEACIKMH